MVDRIRLQFLALVLLTLVHRPSPGLAEPPPRPAALPPGILVLRPRQSAEDQAAAYWADTLESLLGFYLAVPKTVRVVPRSSVAFALNQLKIRPGGAIGEAEARKLAQIAGARFVVSAEYQRTNSSCRLVARLLDTRKTNGPVTFSAAFTNWVRPAEALAGKILAGAGVNLSERERSRLAEPVTTSAEALELLSRAVFDIENGLPAARSETDLRKAVSIDPGFVAARGALVQVLVLEGKLAPAANEALGTVKLHPDSASARTTLGLIYLYEGQADSAVSELTKALRLNPYLDDAWYRLGQAYHAQWQWEQAVSAFRRAEALAPYDPAIHAALIAADARSGELADGASEALLAERYSNGGDADIEYALARGFALLQKRGKAAAHYQKFLATTPTGFQDDRVAEARNYLRQTEARSTPHFVSAIPPQKFSPSDLQSALAARLTSSERRWVSNPLTSSPELDTWADAAVRGARGDMEKTRRLYDRLLDHVDRPGFSDDGFARTATQALGLWKDPETNLTCGDYSVLFVTAARHVGLDAFCVFVSRDTDGRDTLHMCGGVFIGGRALLVDPALQWFGAPHRGYQFMSDLQEAGLFLVDSGQWLDDTKRIKAGLKIIGGWAVEHFEVAAAQLTPVHMRVSLGAQPQPDGGMTPVSGVVVSPLPRASRQIVQAQMRAGLKIEPTHWLVPYIRGVQGMYRSDWAAAETNLRRFLAQNPNYPLLTTQARFDLAGTLVAQHRLPEARQEYIADMNLSAGSGQSKSERKLVSLLDKALQDAAKGVRAGP